MILFRFSFFFNRILALLDVAMPLEVIGCLKSKKKKKNFWGCKMPMKGLLEKLLSHFLGESSDIVFPMGSM
jgi:hypothetical protein